ncbi:MAG: choice-of-anchor I family protein [Novosphingobium sp.]|nr:choice-of-anchor I family protein [Novosphingobium sp.]
MAVIVRIVSADGQKVVTRVLPAVPSKLKVPAGAIVEIVDEATGRKIPLGLDRDDADRKFHERHSGEESEELVHVETVANWPADDTPVSELAADGEFAALVSGSGGFEAAEISYSSYQSDDGDGGGLFDGGSSTLLFGLLGVAVIGGAILLLTDDSDKNDDDDNGGETPDTTAPDAPTGLDLDAADDTGASDSDNVTNKTSGLTISGSAEADSTVELFDGEASLGTATAGSNGAFTLDVSLSEGSHSLTARATDAAGNESASSSTLEITIDATAPAVPSALDLAAADDDGAASDDNVTSVTSGLTISGTTAAGASVELFDGSTSLGTVSANSAGEFTTDVSLALGSHSITAVATDSAGNASAASAPLTIDVVEPTVPLALLNSTIDGNGDIVTLYFDGQLDPASDPVASSFTVSQDGSVAVTDVIIAGNRVTLMLDAPLAASGDIAVSFTGAGLSGLGGEPVDAVSGEAVTNRLDLLGNGAIGLGQSAGIGLNGAEISTFDPETDRLFVTGLDGVQVVQMGEDLSMTLLGTIAVGTNKVTSVAVADGIVAVAVVAEDKVQPGKVYFIDASADVGPGAILGSVDVGSNPDMVTFTPDGKTILVANEAELDEAGNDPEGSVSVIDISGGVASATVQTAGFTAFNSQIDELKAQGVRLFAGEDGFVTTTVAQDLEPEYIAVSKDGTTAFITLQENNAIAILDIATATITAIKPLGLKNFDGLLADFSDRDGADGGNAIVLTTDHAVFGQFMPDSIASFVGGDGQTYYVIANEGDDRDDFLPGFLDGFEEAVRVKDLTLDPTAFPNADAIQEDSALGRLGVSQAPGNDGDTDGDGDIDQLLTYGGRSFSILDAEGNIVFDSGSHIEQFVATGGLYDSGTNTGLLDDGRSDNKGPEPEGITTGVFGDSVLAFVALERGGGGVMVYDVTDPANVEFVQYFRNANDISPEGLVYVSAADSPSGEALLIVTNEVSETVTAYQITEPGTYTLQLLHFADAEAKSLAVETAPNLAALVDAFEDDYVNSITLAGGDNYIPGLFFTAQSDSRIADALGFSGGAKVDIAIHNAIGVQASTIGNHEFDKGTGVFAGVIAASGEYEGALFPYLSANLDFSGDSALGALYQETLGIGGLENAADLANTIVPSAVIEENGELIGIVGATTQVLASITTLGGVTVDGTSANDMALLAQQLQPYIDDLTAQGVNKIIVMSHLQQIELEQELAPLLQGVDIILAAGSNTRLSDADDELVAFPGHQAVSQGDYPIVTAGSDGKPTLIVNTDNEYTYLGRLVVEFDANGEIVTEALDEYISINGAYAATAENVAEAWNTTVEALDDTAFADGTRGAEVQFLVDTVNTVLLDQGSNVYGYSDVYLQGERAFVRSQETNLGNLTADANAYVAREALGLNPSAPVVSYKNGGGIRAEIGSVTGTGSDVVFGPNEGGVVTELDVGAALAFNNGLVVFDTTPQGILNILNSPNVFQAGNGGFGQISGLEVSYDPNLPAGSRVIDVALVNGSGYKVALVDDGVVVEGAPATITMVTLDFIAANDGDGTEIAENGTNFRYIVDNGDGTYSVSETLGIIDEGGGDLVVDTSTFTGDKLGEQQALADYLGAKYDTPDDAFNMADTPQSEDERIQNIDARNDTVLDDLASDIMLEGLEGYATASIFTVSETLSNGYTPPGVMDGIGAMELDANTVRVFVNHELGQGDGYVYELANGVELTGSRISYFDIDKATMQIVDGGLAYDRIYDANGEIVTDNSFLSLPDFTGLSRFCSASLFEADTFGAGNGLVDTIFFTGEEDGGLFNPVSGAEWALDVENGELWALPSFGRGAWENVTQLDTGTTTHVAFILADDTSPFDVDGDEVLEAAPLFLYVGEKSTAADASFIERNGLSGGDLFVWVPADASKIDPESFTGVGESQSGSWVQIDNTPDLSQASDDGSSGYDEYGYPTQSNLWTQAEVLGAFRFSRPEDVSTNPDNASEFVLASTGRQNDFNGADLVGELYTMEVAFDFTGGTFNGATGDLKILYDGDSDPNQTLRSPDNVEWADDGMIYAQEDRAVDGIFGEGAVNQNEAGIVRLDPGAAGADPVRIANIDRSAVMPSGAEDDAVGDVGNWESSGILDVSSLFGKAPGTLFLTDVQAHGIDDQDRYVTEGPAARITDGDLKEGGQLIFLYTEDAAMQSFG